MSKSNQNATNNSVEDIVITNTMITTANGCKYNPGGVQCSFEDCAFCGWNPQVAKKRMEATRAKYTIVKSGKPKVVMV